MPGPLAVPDPLSLDELFSIDPLKLTEADLAKQVEILRRDQVKFLAKEKLPTKKIAAPVNLSLNDLLDEV